MKALPDMEREPKSFWRRVRPLPMIVVAAGSLLAVKLSAMAVAADNMLTDPAAIAAIAPAAGEAKTEDKAAATTEARPDNTAEVAPEFLTRSEIDLLQDLANRRGELEKKAQEIETRERLLMATEKRIDKKIERLKALEANIKSMVQVHDEQEEAQLQSLVRVYENMKPKDAARIFEKLDMPVLLNVVERMKDKKVAPIMGEMHPEAAKALTTELATRRQIATASVGE